LKHELRAYGSLSDIARIPGTAGVIFRITKLITANSASALADLAQVIRRRTGIAAFTQIGPK
jgi:hypothetical protein